MNETPTAQQVFDRTATHLLTQGEKSVDPNDVCAYRGSHGRRCAAGIWIPDGTYRHETQRSQ